MVNDYFSSFYADVLSSDYPAARDADSEKCCSSGVPVMAYIPDQSFVSLYDPCEALFAGTLFAQLNKPFEGKGCRYCVR